MGLHAKYPIFLTDLNETEFSRYIFKKYSNVIFHENLSSGNQVVPCGQTDDKTEVTKPIVAFRSTFCVGRTWNVELAVLFWQWQQIFLVPELPVLALCPIKPKYSTRTFFLEARRSGLVVDYSPSSSSVIKNE